MRTPCAATNSVDNNEKNNTLDNAANGEEAAQDEPTITIDVELVITPNVTHGFGYSKIFIYFVLLFSE